MSKVDGSLGSMVQGVSQQHPRDRLPGQCTEQINMSSDVVDGLKKRYGSRFIADLIANVSTTGWRFYDYDLGVDGQYLVFIRSGEVHIVDLDGNSYTVNSDASAEDYLATVGTLSFTTIKEATYIANSGVVTAMKADVKTTNNMRGIVHAIGSQYGRTYKVTVSWTRGTAKTFTASWTAPDGSTAAHSAQITTTNIITQLQTLLNANTTFNADLETAREADVMLIRPKSGVTDITKFEIIVDDGDAGLNMFGLTDSIGDVGKLPRYAPKGYTVRISGDSGTDVDDWFLEFLPEDDTLAVGAGFGTTGYWVETVAPNTPYLLDTTTMPHVITFDSSTSTFSIAAGEWEGRQVGDAETNETPSFVGYGINDLNNFQDRLVILGGPNIFMSRTKKPLDCWRQSVAAGQLATDPIDMTPTGNTKHMRAAVKHDRDLICFTETAQYIVFGRNAITPMNTSAVETSTFESDLNAKPVSAGANIVFGINYGKYTGMKEFFTEGTTDSNNARVTTEHCPKYLVGNVTHIASSTNFNKIVVHTDADDRSIYINEYMWSGGEKLQNSWSKWMLSETPVYSFFRESRMYLVLATADTLRLVVLDLDSVTYGDFNYPIHLDNFSVHTIDGNTLTAPLVVSDDDTWPDDWVVVDLNYASDLGQIIPVDSYDSSTGLITLSEDVTGTVIVGRMFSTSYIPTRPRMLDRNGKQVTTGTLYVNNFYAQLVDSGPFEYVIHTEYDDPNVLEWDGRILDDPDNIVSVAAVTSERVQLDFYQDVENSELEITSTHHLPLRITDIEWDAEWRKRGTRV